MSASTRGNREPNQPRLGTPLVLASTGYSTDHPSPGESPNFRPTASRARARAAFPLGKQTLVVGVGEVVQGFGQSPM